MSTTYGVAFSTTNPSDFTSLAPTFISFFNMQTGATLAPPGITQLAFTGVYQFVYNASFPTYFVMDGITVTPATNRLVFGVIDPVQQVDVQVADLGSTLIGFGISIYAACLTISATSSSLATGSSLLQSIDERIGTTASTFGSLSTDPGTLYGYLKRNQEFQEGNAAFTKLSGQWNIQSRGGSLIAQKTLQNSASQVTKV